MQLEEQGKLNLDADINQYLDFPIRPAFNKPITLRNLMTHTAGFEETSTRSSLPIPNRRFLLRDYLIANQPMCGSPSSWEDSCVFQLWRRPGKLHCSAHERRALRTICAGAHLRAARHDTLVALPAPAEVAGRSPSRGYRGNTTKPSVGFEIFNPVGAGGVSSSAGDRRYRRGRRC